MTDENVRQVWSEDELDRALAVLNSEVDTDRGRLAAARAELVRAAGGPERAAPPLRRQWGRWAAAAAVVTALVAGTLVIQTVRFGDQPPAASAAAAALNSAADKIGASDQPVAPGQYRYIATHAWWLATTVLEEDRSFSYLAENLLETWVPADQQQEWLWRRDVTGARKWVHGTEPEARAAGVAVDEPGWPEGEWKARCGDWFVAEEGKQPCQEPGGWQKPTPEWLAGLPRDPAQLYARLDADAPDNKRGPTELLVYAADALRSGLVPADVRAALYRALGKLPGLEITDRLANLDGRVGIAYGMSDGINRHEIIIDPETGEFIGERQTVVKDTDGLKAGTVTTYTSMSTAVVNQLGVRPTG
jgi:hypothetical protein